ncbi:HNT [Lepeophtheirus salmonis]|uniref:HNT n=1 Tax=Lepeophtheirus salmonis TaxID=72036 RepID=A0A7R8H8N7_LEPSM|nr:HNT [Lepeophtheirus salmonis]CAF2926062.1 HNT [Lepeophtheirus salmonis]
MPKFIGKLENMTVSEGRDASFTCTVTNLGGHRVAWIKSDDKAILAIHDHVITNNERLHVTHNDKDTWTLQIKNVKQKDTGEYMCQVNSVPMVSQIAALEVVVPPEISDRHSTSDLSVAEGSSAKLHCAAKGHPSPEIIWRREGRDSSIYIRSSKHGKVKMKKRVKSGTLFLPSVTRSDMGNYMCIASNGVPPAVSKTIKLIINFQPQLEVTNQLIGAPLMTEISLSCTIEASPKPITFWTNHKGAMIVPNSKYQIVERDQNSYRSTSTLIIKKLEKSDFSEFECVSKNTIGQSEETIKLYEIQLETTKASIITTKKDLQFHSSDSNGDKYKFSSSSDIDSQLFTRNHRRIEDKFNNDSNISNEDYYESLDSNYHGKGLTRSRNDNKAYSFSSGLRMSFLHKNLDFNGFEYVVKFS